jgi:hypothetical protein
LPSRNLTVPVGVGPPATAATVAVKVTGWPKKEGFGEELTIVTVAPVFTN